MKVGRFFNFVILILLALTIAIPAGATPTPPEIELDPELQLSQPVEAIDQALTQVSGEVEVVVQLADAPLAVANGANAKKTGGMLNRGQQQRYTNDLNLKQNITMSQIIALGGVESGRVRIAYNALIVRIDAAQLPAVAAIPGVIAIRPVVNYELDLFETVPYIGAASVQNSGFDGSGVSVAVLDSGIDYTHYNLGGPGTTAAYDAAYGLDIYDPLNTTTDGLFPTAKVIGGYDFVGELWPTFGPRTEDPDPIDFEGHGTHVADIIAGRSNDGAHKGVAPGASLLAVKVCSAVSSSCNGVALLKGVDFALDPNMDGAMNDAVDVINMSLGSSYGQREDDLSFASANAARAGVVVVASAGNSADRPYILGSPSSTPEVISVAQTQVPSAATFPLVVNSPANIAGVYANTETLSWAPIDAGFTGDVAYVGRGCNTDPYLADPNGKVALIDRGVCAISEKVRRASDAGAIGVLIGLVAPGDAITFSNGGQCPEPADGTCKPSLVIIQSYANLIKANLSAPVNGSVTPAVVTPLVGSMVGSSSRGPSYSFNAIKPDVGAPGASLSAEVGTGIGETRFGGTSGAAPMVSGSAALLVSAYPNRSVAEIKSLLMNTAETTIYINPATQPGVLAPITRIGGGEVRVDRALGSTTAAWDAEANTGSLSFGYQPLTSSQTFTRQVRVQNYSNVNRTYNVAPSFRYADDAASGAVTVSAPSSINVPPKNSRVFNVTLTVDASKLPVWTLNGGSRGGNGALLQSVEFDGYITISDASDNIHLAWQIMPHRSAGVKTNGEQVVLNGGNGAELMLQNQGNFLDGRVETFSLTGTSPRITNPNLPGDGDNYAVIDLAAVGVRLVGSSIQFAINTFGQRAHPAYPGGFEVDIDTDLDGDVDYFIYNAELGGFAFSGQTVVYVGQVGGPAPVAYFFADADLNSGNIILTAPLAALGLTANTQFSFTILAYDNYFTGFVTDVIKNMVYTAGVPRFFLANPVFTVPAALPAGGSTAITVQAFPGGDTASPSQSGLLFLYRDGMPGREADTLSVFP
jgi:subtilisin family serine protease